MSRLWIFSDLHQGWADNASDPTSHAPDFDIAIFAGYVHSPLTNAIDSLSDRIAGAPVIYTSLATTTSGGIKATTATPTPTRSRAGGIWRRAAASTY